MFHLNNHHGYAENVPLQTLVETYGTPLYVYSAAQIEKNYKNLSSAMAATGLKTKIHFAVKANYNLAVLRHLCALGAGADVVSSGEMQRALTAGMASSNIIFSGVGKTDDELRAAIAADVCQINLESAEEMARLAALARTANKKINCTVRINPDVDANTHAKINTGKSEHKFGVDLQTAAEMFDAAGDVSEINLRGLSMHIGSQLLDVAPFDEAFSVMAKFARDRAQIGHTIDMLDIGGGLGVTYHAQDKPADLAKYAGHIKKHFSGFTGRIATEPGRFLVADAGALLTRVVFIKRTAHKIFVVLDAAMNDLMRPALYDAYHPIFPAAEPKSKDEMVCDIVGGICESTDKFASDRALPANLQPGDLMVIGMAGAYGATMSNTYNARDLVAEVMVRGTDHALVRERWSIAEQLKLEKIPDWLR